MKPRGTGSSFAPSEAMALRSQQHHEKPPPPPIREEKQVQADAPVFDAPETKPASPSPAKEDKQVQADPIPGDTLETKPVSPSPIPPSPIREDKQVQADAVDHSLIPGVLDAPELKPVSPSPKFHEPTIEEAPRKEFLGSEQQLDPFVSGEILSRRKSADVGGIHEYRGSKSEFAPLLDTHVTAPPMGVSRSLPHDRSSTHSRDDSRSIGSRSSRTALRFLAQTKLAPTTGESTESASRHEVSSSSGASWSLDEIEHKVRF